MRFSWAWAPFIAIAASAVANAALIYAVTQVRPQTVSDHPYLDSFHHDAEAAARQCFRDHAFHLEYTQHQDQIRLVLGGATQAVNTVEILCYRPANGDCDQRLTWMKPQEPLLIALPKAGRWRIRLSGLVTRKPILADLDVDLIR